MHGRVHAYHVMYASRRQRFELAREAACSRLAIGGLQSQEELQAHDLPLESIVE